MWLPQHTSLLGPKKSDTREFKVRLLSDNHKTTESRAQVIASWKNEGGVLLMGYEMFRLLTNNKARRRKKKRKNAPLGGIIETIDLEEEDRTAEIVAGQDLFLPRFPEIHLLISRERQKQWVHFSIGIQRRPQLTDAFRCFSVRSYTCVEMRSFGECDDKLPVCQRWDSNFLSQKSSFQPVLLQKSTPGMLTDSPISHKIV